MGGLNGGPLPMLRREPRTQDRMALPPALVIISSYSGGFDQASLVHKMRSNTSVRMRRSATVLGECASAIQTSATSSTAVPHLGTAPRSLRRLLPSNQSWFVINDQDLFSRSGFLRGNGGNAPQRRLVVVVWRATSSAMRSNIVRSPAGYTICQP